MQELSLQLFLLNFSITNYFIFRIIIYILIVYLKNADHLLGFQFQLLGKVNPRDDQKPKTIKINNKVSKGLHLHYI